MIAVLSNALLAIIQVIYANQAHSVSLLSDALHNLGDVLGLFIAWGAQTLAKSTSYPPRYTYGYKQSTILAAFINALLLLGSVGIILRETLLKITHTDPMNGMQVVYIASFGILINGLTALLFMEEKETNINIKAAFLHLILDALTSLAVVISAIIVYYGGYQWLDSMMALVIAGIISISGWKLLRRSLDLILGAVPTHINLAEVNQYLMKLPGVYGITHLHIWAIGTEESALTAHLIRNDTVNLPLDYHLIQKELANQYKIHQVTLQTAPPSIEISTIHYLTSAQDLEETPVIEVKKEKQDDI
jgi:cobalt-zinc-cadmium efflux system protein